MMISNAVMCSVQYQRIKINRRLNGAICTETCMNAVSQLLFEIQALMPRCIEPSEIAES